MSYGEWRKRGKGWATLEIDTPSHYTVYDLKSYNPSAYARITSMMSNFTGETFHEDYDNPTAVSFHIRHAKKGRNVLSWNVGGGEHSTWFAFDNSNALQDAMAANYMKPMSEEWLELLAYASRIGVIEQDSKTKPSSYVQRVKSNLKINS